MAIMRVIEDKDADEVDVFLTHEPIAAISYPVDEFVFIRVNPKTDEPVGVTITNFQTWFAQQQSHRPAVQWRIQHSLRGLRHAWRVLKGDIRPSDPEEIVRSQVETVLRRYRGHGLIRSQ